MKEEKDYRILWNNFLLTIVCRMVFLGNSITIELLMYFIKEGVKN